MMGGGTGGRCGFIKGVHKGEFCGDEIDLHLGCGGSYTNIHIII